MGERKEGVYWITPKLRGDTFATLANYDPDRPKCPWEINGLYYTEEQLTNLYEIGNYFDEIRNGFKRDQT
jgi:hypothetical protein